MKDAIVIGGGIIGATVANRLAVTCPNGVMLVDDLRLNSGTVPSGGHLKPSWFGGMPKTEYEPAMELLADAWGLEESRFRLRPTDRYEIVFRVDTDVVVRFTENLATRCTATAVKNLEGFPEVTLSDGRTERTRLLLLATGAWAADLLPDVKVVRKQGVSFRIKGAVAEPFIKPWAPYKQVVVHQQSPDELWAGDGTAVYPENWKDERTKKCRHRCLVAIGGGEVVRTDIGYRPYAKGQFLTDPCLLQRLGPRAWLATGAGKSGTIAAGWAAVRILRELR